MRIECPFCGERDVSEFTYLGDADFRHPPAPDTAELAQRYLRSRVLARQPGGTA